MFLGSHYRMESTVMRNLGLLWLDLYRQSLLETPSAQFTSYLLLQVYACIRTHIHADKSSQLNNKT